MTPLYTPRQIRAMVLGYERYIGERQYIELIWEKVSKPLKFPDRRRREDRQIPSPGRAA
jgi:hypothetical protein